MSKNLIFLFVLACGLWQCTEVTELRDEIDREYFPVKVGNYWIYDVSEATFSNQYVQEEPVDSITYQVRERIDTVFRDQTGELTYKLIRSRRSDPSQAWGNDSIVLIQKSSLDLRYTRDNLKTVRLLFPVTENKTWNGNAFNSREAREYAYTQVGQPFTLGDSTYRQTVRVVQEYNDNLVDLDDSHEVFALGVGMVYKRIIDFIYCTGGEPGTDCETGKRYILYGRRIYYKLQAYGHQD
ncbi:MAG: hypothetical protein ACO1NZ_01200 [Adhaeribacter sp.]